ncbi:hypothetical protein BRCH_02766c [Candidatus Burkholderia brachyanthoides]|nr:hypothetical protein BRCH_02766c [Candidatus Burkholderia brachyanthoides]
MSITMSTESDVIGEVRNQYERNGILLKSMMDSAADDTQSAAQSSGELVTQFAETAHDTAQETSGVVLDASGEVAKSARASAKRAL